MSSADKNLNKYTHSMKTASKQLFTGKTRAVKP